MFRHPHSKSPIDDDTPHLMILSSAGVSKMVMQANLRKRLEEDVKPVIVNMVSKEPPGSKTTATEPKSTGGKSVKVEEDDNQPESMARDLKEYLKHAASKSK